MLLLEPNLATLEENIQEDYDANLTRLKISLFSELERACQACQEIVNTPITPQLLTPSVTSCTL